MFKDVEELKDLLREMGYEDTVVFENPSYIKAIIGISDVGGLCYSYEKNDSMPNGRRRNEL